MTNGIVTKGIEWAMPRPRPLGQKRCPDCATVKPDEDFYHSDKYDGGLSPYCKPCARARNRGRSPELQEKIRAAARAKYHENKPLTRDADNARSRGRAAQLRDSDPAAYRAKKFFDGARMGVAEDVTREYLTALFANVRRCQCCGKNLQLAFEPRSTRQYRANPDSPSVDRVDNRKGYTRRNVAIICWECNFRKTDLTLSDLAMFTRYIELFGDSGVV